MYPHTRPGESRPEVSSPCNFHWIHFHTRTPAWFGRTLSAEVRANDTTCRLGGEEFVVVAAGLGAPAASELVDRIRAAWVDDAPYPVTFSAGVAPVTGSGGTPALLAADRALYRAKRRGRNRTEIEAAECRRDVLL